MEYAFAEHVLDVRRRELRRGTELLRLEPQVFDLLVYLVQHRDRFVPADDLLEAVWGGRIVSDSALTTRINAARRAIGDSGESQRLIRTLPRRGFRFVAEVEESGAGEPLPAAAPAPSRVVPGCLPVDEASIAVLPFACLGGGAEQEAVSEGAVEEIMTALSRIGWVHLVARRSSFSYKGQLVDVKRIGEQLGARYLLDGSVRNNGGRIRIAVQLLEAETGAHLWAERFDGAAADVFELQDRVAASVAGALQPAMEIVEIHRSVLRPTDGLTAQDLYLRALPGCYSYDTRPLLRAHDLLQQAIERDPGFGPALAAAAGCRQFLAATGWIDDPEANRLKAVELARQALQADGDDPAVLAEAARVLGYFTEDIDTAIALSERAVSRHPSYARGWFWNGWIRMLAGQPDLAIEHLQTASRLNPRHRTYSNIGMAHFFGRRYPEAIDALNASLRERPGWPTTLRFLAAAHAQLGQFGKARQAADRLRAITPAFVPPADCLGGSPYRNREQLTLYVEGLHLAAEAV